MKTKFKTEISIGNLFDVVRDVSVWFHITKLMFFDWIEDDEWMQKGRS